MDELRAFFNDPCSSNSKVIKLRGPLTGGFRITKDDNINDLNRREDHRRSVIPSGTDYAREVKERETQSYLKIEAERARWDSMSGGLDSLEQLTSLGSSLPNIDELTEEAMTEVYSKYSFLMKEDTNNLAINASKTDILDRIRGFPIVVIEGPTGCGKTTQVPQWILDDCYKSRKPCKIIVTQPRRIAAISIAKRVAQERGWDVGGLVGYQVGLENRTSNDTRIHYVTTGVLLQKLVNSKTMNEYTHIILDEVHERGQDMDFLLLVVKKLHYTVSPKVKIVLMSATFNFKNFADYFDIPSPTGQHMTSCVQVKRNNPMFVVKTYYLDGLSKFGSILEACTPKNTDPVIVPEMYHLVVKLVNAFEQLDLAEMKYNDRSEADLPSVLIFLPGINEIEEQYAALTNLELRRRVGGVECPKYKWWVLPLHSTITADEQVRVFQRAPPGERKIILATNIAESSITVPDIKYVIDFCLAKVLVADEQTNFTSLTLTWASKSNCEQRAGRAGRVRDGRVYRLVRSKFYESLKPDSVPEIKRCPLERLVLLAKMLDMGPPSDVLALAMDPPDMSNIHRTMLVLKEIGALKKTVNDEWCSADGDITYMGRIMAKLPLDVKVSKIIILGHIFGCLEECIIMAAALSVKNVCSSPFRERLNAYNSKLTWADGSTSDCVAFLNIYKVWNHLRHQQYFKQAGNNEAQWARRFYVQVRGLRELDDMVRELRLRLSREGIEPLRGTSPWTKNDLAFVYKVILAGAFYPQYFLQGSHNEEREREAVRELGGHDPRTTVYLKGFPEAQPGAVYAAAVKNAVHQHIREEPRVSFDANSRKVFLTFPINDELTRRDKNNSGDPTIPGQVALPVYKAIKMRQLRMDIRIPLLPVEQANELLAAMESTRSDVPMDMHVPRLPAINDTYFPLKISQFVNVGKFWVQYNEESVQSELNTIQALLNSGKLLSHTGDVTRGAVLAAPYTDGRVYRARVRRHLPRDMLEIAYIDYGTFGRVSSTNLRQLPPGPCHTTPPLAMPCSLAETAPAPLLDKHNAWTPAATQLFQDFVRRPHLLGKIYSVTQGVVAIDVLADNGSKSVRQELIRAGLAVAAEESYDSQMNHDLRLSVSELTMLQINRFNDDQVKDAFQELREYDAPKPKDCYTDVCLKDQVKEAFQELREYDAPKPKDCYTDVCLKGQVKEAFQELRKYDAPKPKDCYTDVCLKDQAKEAFQELREYDAPKPKDCYTDVCLKDQVKEAFQELRKYDAPKPKDYYTDVCLKGPFSPLESTLRNLMFGSRDKVVQIEWNSINSVLLDTEPQRVYERLLVAADVGQNERSSKLTLRHTTLMPNVPGLPAIISLLFCPTAEVRRSACGARYANALCGLGADDAGAPYFPEHDLLVQVDADLDTDDVSRINHIRYLMDFTMRSSDEDARSNIPHTIREQLLRLVMKRRRHRETETIIKAWDWHSVPDDELMEIGPAELMEGSEVFPLHVPQELRPVGREQLEQLKREVDQLHQLVARTESVSAERACPLCGTGPMPMHMLRIHLRSTAHREKEEDFRIFNS